MQLYSDYLDAFKQNYDSEQIKDEEKRGRDYKQFGVIDNRSQEPKLTKKEETETKKTLMKYKNHHKLNKIKMIMTH